MMTPPVQSVGGGFLDYARFRDLIVYKTQFVVIALESQWRLNPMDQAKPNE